MEIHLTTTECHLPYGITQCYLTADTSEHSNTPRLYPSQTGWYSIYWPFKDGMLSKPRPRVRRATGPRLLRDSPGQRDPNPQCLSIANHYRLSRRRIDSIPPAMSVDA